jgi:hypothetical protein
LQSFGGSPLIHIDYCRILILYGIAVTLPLFEVINNRHNGLIIQRGMIIFLANYGRQSAEHDERAEWQLPVRLVNRCRQGWCGHRGM